MKREMKEKKKRERERERERERDRERERERGERAPEKAAFGLAGLTYSRRYTATNDDVSPLLRKRSNAGTAGAPYSAFCQDWNSAFAERIAGYRRSSIQSVRSIVAASSSSR